jgi:predicted PurR-regulated permease PerM
MATSEAPQLTPAVPAPTGARRRSRQHRRRPAHSRLALPITVALIAAAAFAAMAPLAAPLLLAAWVAIVTFPLYQRMAKRIHRRKGAAAMITVLLVLAFLVPIVVTTLSLSLTSVELVQRVLRSSDGAEALKAFTAGQANLSFDSLKPQQLFDLARRHGASAWQAAQTMFGAATAAVIGIVVFVAGFYSFLTNGPRVYAWLLERSPLSLEHSQRFAGAFVETGRGLLIGTGLTALLQGGVATVGYVVIGVPQALVLGTLTVFASLIPSVGSGLVWFPVTVGLALSGQTGSAIAMAAVGCFVSVLDNLMRPLLARHAKLELPSLVLFVAMLGGIAMFGGFGLLLGPLFVRLGTEGLTLLKESRARAATANGGL